MMPNTQVHIPPSSYFKCDCPAVLGFAACTGLPRVAAGDEVRIGYISRAVDHPPALSNLDEPLTDEGVQGARLGIDDNNSTGRFTKQSFTLEEKVLAVGGDVVAALQELADAGITFVISDLDAAGLDSILAAPGADKLFVLNSAAPDDRFRSTDCKSFLVHTLPSCAMLGDALGQYLIKKN